MNLDRRRTSCASWDARLAPLSAQSEAAREYLALREELGG
jgi:hypothetical protein